MLYRSLIRASQAMNRGRRGRFEPLPPMPSLYEPSKLTLRRREEEEELQQFLKELRNFNSQDLSALREICEKSRKNLRTARWAGKGEGEEGIEMVGPEASSKLISIFRDSVSDGASGVKEISAVLRSLAKGMHLKSFKNAKNGKKDGLEGQSEIFWLEDIWRRATRRLRTCMPAGGREKGGDHNEIPLTDLIDGLDSMADLLEAIGEVRGELEEGDLLFESASNLAAPVFIGFLDHLQDRVASLAKDGTMDIHALGFKAKDCKKLMEALNKSSMVSSAADRFGVVHLLLEEDALIWTHTQKSRDFKASSLADLARMAHGGGRGPEVEKAEQAIRILEGMLLMKLTSLGSIQSLLKVIMQAPVDVLLDDDSSDHFKRLKQIELSLRLDFPQSMASLDPDISEFLSRIVRDLRFFDRKIQRLSAGTYQLKGILETQFKVPVESIMVGPHPIQIAHPDLRIIWEVSEEKELKSSLKLRQLEALGWQVFKIGTEEWEGLREYEEKCYFVRQMLKEADLISA